MGTLTLDERNDLPAFVPGNATSQLLRSPKLHIVDSGLAAFLARREGHVVGVEVELASSPGDKSLDGLRRLRRSSGSRWAGGVMLCRVPAGRVTDDGLGIAPIEAVWAAH